MKDQLSARIAELTAEAQRVREDKNIERYAKQDRLGALQSEITRLMEARRMHKAQRTNGISPMEQRGRRY